jgi:hypothetical protein
MVLRLISVKQLMAFSHSLYFWFNFSILTFSVSIHLLQSNLSTHNNFILLKANAHPLQKTTSVWHFPNIYQRKLSKCWFASCLILVYLLHKQKQTCKRRKSAAEGNDGVEEYGTGRPGGVDAPMDLHYTLHSTQSSKLLHKVAMNNPNKEVLRQQGHHTKHLSTLCKGMLAACRNSNDCQQTET